MTASHDRELHRPAPRTPTELTPWLTVYVLASGFFVGMEWLFFVTKPSFLNAFTWAGRVRVFGAALLPMCAAGAGVMAVLAAAARIPVWPIQLVCYLGIRALPTLVLSASGLLLVENFTTTLFGWGITTLRGARLPYAAGVLIGVVILWQRVGRWGRALHPASPARRVATAVAVGLVAIAATGAAHEQLTRLPLVRPTPSRPASRPNVLLIGLDGVNAAHLSVYGYHRETSPSITALARDALVFTNAYSNAANTGGALTAILTGRLPTETRVIFAPDILRGDASVLHLPALLRAVGYRTGQFAVRHYAASIDYDMRGGFDVVNGSDTKSGVVSSPALGPFGTGGYFLGQILDRVATRVGFLSGHRERSAFAEVTEPLTAEYMDTARLEELKVFLTEAPEPWFAHIHLLVTHGARFSPRERHFSAGQSQVSDWMTDFYDDAVLDADQSIAEIVALLRDGGVFDRTLVVVYSDHAQGSRTERPVPLLIRLAHASRHGRVHETVQTTDIAPTIVDALGLHPPDWMTGRSLLRDIPSCRRVFASIATDRVHFRRADYTVPSPPFFSLGAASLVQGNQWFILELQGPTPALAAGVNRTSGTDAACTPLTRSAARLLIIEHLRVRGYEVPSSYVSAR
jgi:arylsulfatase A-like enzyme